MNYQVWIKEEYEEKYTKVDCGDLPAVKREIEKAAREGKEPLLTVEVPYEYNVKIGEVGSEVKKSKSKSDKGPGPEGESPVRSGDSAAVQELDK